jgi:hypothetical protein
MFEQVNLEEIISQLKIIYQTEFTIYKKKERKRIAKPKIEKIIRDYRIKNTDGAYNRALGNAVKHGSCPVNCKIYVGKDGEIIIVIQDSGKGFDFKKMLEKYRKGKVYYSNHGKGVRTYSSNKHSKVSWHNNGNTIAILYNI